MLTSAERIFAKPLHASSERQPKTDNDIAYCGVIAGPPVEVESIAQHSRLASERSCNAGRSVNDLWLALVLSELDPETLLRISYLFEGRQGHHKLPIAKRANGNSRNCAEPLGDAKIAFGHENSVSCAENDTSQHLSRSV
jgi:hypothetical protein